MLVSNLEYIPAYYIEYCGKKIPFLVSLLFVDDNKQIKLPPVVEKSINKVCDITCRETLAYIKISEFDKQKLEHCFFESDKNNAILLFLCFTVELAENLMCYFKENYNITLIKNV